MFSGLLSYKNGKKSAENLYLCTYIYLFAFSLTVPECSNRIQSADEDLKKAGDVCNINELFSCSENQVCVQLQPDNNMGQCQCLQGYDKQDDGVIISKEIQIINRLFLDIAMYCQASSSQFNQSLNLSASWLGRVPRYVHAVGSNSLETTYILFQLPYLPLFYGGST